MMFGGSRRTAPRFTSDHSSRIDRTGSRLASLQRVAAMALLGATILLPRNAGADELDPEWMESMRRHVAEAVPKEPDTLDAWEAADWSPGLERNPTWMAPGQFGLPAQQSMAYQRAYEATFASRRAAAVRRFSATIAALFTVDKGMVPAEAAKVCQRRTAAAPVALGNLFGAPPDPRRERERWEAVRAKPAMTGLDAQEVIWGTCRLQLQATVTSRITLAEGAAKVSGVFAATDQLAVPAHADGQLIEFDPAALVRTAAADNIQVSFGQGGFFDRTPTMVVTPFGRSAPKLEGKILRRANPDGTNSYVVTGLGNLPGARTPEATVGCLAVSSEEFGRQAHSAVLGSGLGILFGGGGRSLGTTMREVENYQGCADAKTAFVAGGTR